MGLYAPSFNSEYIFGTDVTMVTVDPPRESQVNSFLGINGVEILDHGSRQRYTEVTGKLQAPDEAGLGMLENRFRSYKDAYGYTLVTTDGLYWENVKLESFQPTPPIRVSLTAGVVFRNYRARFIHAS
jgi:hypothetical protein